ncbi:MAG TPA: hypothetical protein VGC71_12220 [Gaiellales bacterium]|jgi:hypothetical protein
MFPSLHVPRITSRIALAVAFVAMLTAGNAAASSTSITLDGTPITATTTSAGEKANISFSGTTGHRVSVRISSSSVTNYTIALKAPDGSVVKTSGTWGVAGGFMGPVNLTQTGTYKFVITPSSTLKGKWTVAAWDVPADLTGTIATDGTTTTQAYAAPGQNGTMTFSGTAGQRISLLAGAGATSARNVTVSIKAPSTATVLASTAVGTGGMFFEPITLAETGTYTITANPPKYTTGSTDYKLWVVPADQTGTLTLGAGNQVLTFGTPGQNASLTFSGTSGQKITLSAAASLTGPITPGATVKIKKPDSTVLTTIALTNSGALMEPTTLPATGTYTVTVDPTAESTGTVTLNAFVSPADLTGALTSGTPTTAALTTVGQNASYTISATSGQYLAVKFANDGISSTKVTITNPSNATITNGSATFGTTGKFFDAVQLTASGTYTIKVDPQGTATGSVDVTAYAFTNPSTQSATLGTPLTVTTVPGQNAQITFTAAAKDSIQFSNITAGSTGISGLTASLYQGSTQIGSSWTFGNSDKYIDTLSLTAGATYKLLLDPSGQNAGSVTTTIYSVPADATYSGVTLGSTTAVSVATPGQNAKVTFTGTAAHQLSLWFTNVTIGSAIGSGSTVTLTGPTGSAVGTSWTLNAHDTFREPVTLPSTGTYTLSFDPAGNYTGGFSVTPYDVPADASTVATVNGGTFTATSTVPGQNMQISFTTTTTSPVTVNYDVTSTCNGATISLWKAGVQVTSWGTHNAGDTMTTFNPVSGTNTYVVKVDPMTNCTGDAVIFVTQ